MNFGFGLHVFVRYMFLGQIFVKNAKKWLYITFWVAQYREKWQKEKVEINWNSMKSDLFGIQDGETLPFFMMSVLTFTHLHTHS